MKNFKDFREAPTVMYNCHGAHSRIKEEIQEEIVSVQSNPSKLSKTKVKNPNKVKEIPGDCNQPIQ